MDNKTIFNEVKKTIYKRLANEGSGHDYYHLERVFNLSLTIQKEEGGNELVVGIASLIHDFCRPWEVETGKSHFSEEALEIIRKDILDNLEITDSDKEEIIDIVRKHDLYDWSTKDNTKSIELQIIQDADNLDAIGAIGIGRCFAYSGHHNRLMWLPEENLDFDNDYVEKPNSSSAISHFYEKLLNLKDNMNTATGQKLAEKRHEFMEKFLEEFFLEWKGEI